MLRFIGRELPRAEAANNDYWGVSEMEHIFDELQKYSATSANIAQLVFQSNITTLKMSNLGDVLAMGNDRMRQRMLDTMAQENRLRTAFGLQLLSSGDQLETHSMSFSGLSDVYEQFMLDMAGASEIPATRLFGRSPQGLNATGESDIRNYYEMIAQMQERHLRPALEKLFPILAISAWGEAPQDAEITFEPLTTLTPSARAELESKLSSSVIEAFKTGLITREEAVRELRARGEGMGFWGEVGG